MTSAVARSVPGGVGGGVPPTDWPVVPQSAVLRTDRARCTAKGRQKGSAEEHVELLFSCWDELALLGPGNGNTAWKAESATVGVGVAELDRL